MDFCLIFLQVIYYLQEIDFKKESHGLKNLLSDQSYLCLEGLNNNLGLLPLKSSFGEFEISALELLAVLSPVRVNGDKSGKNANLREIP